MKIFRVEGNSDVVEMDSEARIYKVVVFVRDVLHIQLSYRCDVILVFLPGHVVNLDVHKVVPRWRDNLAIVKTGIWEKKAGIRNAKLGCVEFGLLGDDLFDQPTN